MEKRWGFGQYLIEQGYIEARDLEKGLASSRESGERIGEVLVRLGFLSKNTLFEVLSAFLQVPRIILTEVRIDAEACQLVSEDIAQRNLLFPFQLQDGMLRVAMADPSSVRALEDVRLFTGLKVEPYLAQESEIRSAIRQHLVMPQSAARLADMSHLAETPEAFAVEAGATAGEDAPTIRLVDSILEEAVRLGASDIHWEPQEKGFKIRFRVDGELALIASLPLQAARSVVSRLKTMAKMDVAERRLPQDGRFAIDLSERRIDLRVSTLPTVVGEKAVIRILDPETAERSLSTLGMRPDVEDGLRHLLQEPHGLILVTGPTGSGKTTTLYALLREVQREAINIVSIEDPVEYRLPGVVQVQVNVRTGLTFAHGLRAILRQDPDVILIGEIRDEATARIATTAALTGHLVFSTLHTNTAAEAITRLIDMGLEPYLLADALNGVLSQRLVRVLCPYCKRPAQGEAKHLMADGDSAESLFYEARGCSHCRGTGYMGRVGVHEFLPYHENIRQLVLNRQGSKSIENEARKAGMLTLWEDGMMKAQRGLTSLEEVLHVASEIENQEGR